MTGNDIIDAALREVAREGTLPLEGGATLREVLEQGLNRLFDEVATAHAFSWLRATSPTTLTTSSGTFRYTLPARVIEVESVVLTSPVPGYALCRLPLQRFRVRWADRTTQAKPVEWASVNDNTIELGPTPDSVYTLEVTTLDRPSEMVEFTSEVRQIPARYHEVLVWGLAARAASVLKQEADFARLSRLFAVGVQRMISEDIREPGMTWSAQPFRPARPLGEYWRDPAVRWLNGR